MLNKRILKPTPNNSGIMNTYLYESLAETNKEIFDNDFLNVLYTIVKPGDTIRLLKKDMKNKLLCYLEYFIIDVNLENKTVDFVITVTRIFNKKEFKFLENADKLKNVKDNSSGASEE